MQKSTNFRGVSRRLGCAKLCHTCNLVAKLVSRWKGTHTHTNPLHVREIQPHNNLSDVRMYVCVYVVHYRIPINSRRWPIMTELNIVILCSSVNEMGRRTHKLRRAPSDIHHYMLCIVFNICIEGNRATRTINELRPLVNCKWHKSTIVRWCV